MKIDAERARADYLPDFCTQRTTLAIVLIVKLTAFVLALARQSALDFWADLARTALFLLWIGLAGAALLCALRAPLARAAVAVASAAVLVLMALVVAAVSVCAYLIGRTHAVIDAGAAGAFPATAGSFALRDPVHRAVGPAALPGRLYGSP